ncbi:MAG: baseplate J/gp47 family protein [Brevinema sp.]
MLIFKSLEELLSEIMIKVKQKIPQITNFKTGGVLRLFIEVVALFLSRIYDEIKGLLPQLFIHTSTDSYLDQHAEQLGLKRHQATTTFGKLTLYRDKANNNITIPADKIFSTAVNSKGSTYRFKSINETIFPEDSKEIEIDIIAEDIGSNYNVFENTITEIVTPISGIDSVNNNSGWITIFGRDIKKDDSLRSRSLFMWKSINGANADAYISWAKAIVGVSKIKILDMFRGTGTIDILILGENNELPSDKILIEVTENIIVNKPIGSDVLVKSPDIVLINLDISVIHDTEIPLIDVDIREKVNKFFQQIDIGEKFEDSALNAKIFELEGIKSLSIRETFSISKTQNLLSKQSSKILPFQIAKLGETNIVINEE